MEETKENVNYLPLMTGDTLKLGEISLECVFSFTPDIHDVNGNSLVFTLSYKDFCLTLTGDMTEETLNYMETYLSDRSLFYHPDILQIPHHGYMAGIGSDILYKTTLPEYALLDCTIEEFENNSVNIQEHIKMIENLGIKVIKRFMSNGGNEFLIYTSN